MGRNAEAILPVYDSVPAERIESGLARKVDHTRYRQSMIQSTLNESNRVELPCCVTERSLLNPPVTLERNDCVKWSLNLVDAFRQ